LSILSILSIKDRRSPHGPFRFSSDLANNGRAHIEAQSPVRSLGSRSPSATLIPISLHASPKTPVSRERTPTRQICARKPTSKPSASIPATPFTKTRSSGGRARKTRLDEKPLAQAIENDQAMVVAAAKQTPASRSPSIHPPVQPLVRNRAPPCAKPENCEISTILAEYIHNLLYQANQTDSATGRELVLGPRKPIVGVDSHPLDLLRWFSGAQVVEASGYCPTKGSRPCTIRTFHRWPCSTSVITALLPKVSALSAAWAWPHATTSGLYGTLGTIERTKVGPWHPTPKTSHPEFAPLTRIVCDIPTNPNPRLARSIRENRSPRCHLFDGANSTVAPWSLPKPWPRGKPLPRTGLRGSD